MKRIALCVAALCSVGIGCADTQQDRVTLPLLVAGTEVPDRFETARGVSITLDRADLAFGPFYLCASTEAGEACDTARGEWLDTAVVDALDPTAANVGELNAVSGAYRSFMYDLGIASLLTQDDAVALDAAQALGGVSVVLEGRATLNDVETPFSLAMPVARTLDNELGVPIVRVRADDEARHEVSEDDASLEVRFDPREWLTNVDFAVVCADANACTNLDADSQAGRSVRNALTAGTPPTLHWNQQP